LILEFLSGAHEESLTRRYLEVAHETSSETIKYVGNNAHVTTRLQQRTYRCNKIEAEPVRKRRLERRGADEERGWRGRSV